MRKDSNFERIIFQGQSDGSIIILLHDLYKNNIIEIEFENLRISWIPLFVKYQLFLDLVLQANS